MRPTILLCALVLSGALFGQVTSLEDAEMITRQYLSDKSASWGLTNADIAEMRLSSSHTSDHNGVTHVYMVQQYHGADIEYATYNANVLDGKVVLAYQKLVPGFTEMIRSGEASVSPEEAVQSTLGHFGQAIRQDLKVSRRQGLNRYVYDPTGISYSDVYSELVYTKATDGLYDLVWKVTLEPSSEENMYSVYVNAASGEVIRTKNLSLSCNFVHTHSDECSEHDFDETPLPTANAGDGAQYLVVPIPFESPNHADRRLVVDPADDDASPYGWHDLNGVEGVESTTTFGNNVHAFADRDGDFDENEVIVDGGASLEFIFPFPQEQEPEMYQPASVTNLFYMNNIMHDFSYHYGFTEEAGNFQEFNYTPYGDGGDHVRAHAQFGAGTSNPPVNNAVFSTPRDGSNGRMRMYVWEGDNKLLRVDEPSVIAGAFSTGTTTDGWAAEITSEPVTGEVAIVSDGTGTPSLGCYPLVNGNDIDGKIALIDRGECDFGCKALYAQDEGAIGFIICNVQEGLVNMLPGECGTEVTIPGVFLSSSDCQTIRAYVDNGLVISLVSDNDTVGPSNRAGSFDNSIIAHEYGHGISNRLTHGRENTDCLTNYDNDQDGTADNGEQMGEGWSDFFSLVTTVKSTDDASRPRGIATYAENQDTSGIGIRSYPYAVDMSINPLTYDDIAFGSVPHGIGTVWCSMLWDLYWALTDKYGFDPDLYRGNGGNNLAIQLVMDGMKMQPCQPTFKQGRDAILKADSILTGQENAALIWEVFARRGLGYSADAGDEADRADGREAYDVKPDVYPTIKLYKDMSPWVEAGESITVTLTIHNHRPEAATSVLVSDVIPEGTEIVPGSGSMGFSQQGDMVVFDIGTLQPADSIEISYDLISSPNIVSDRLFFDDIEDGVLNWAVTSEQGTETWKLEQDDVYSGSRAWKIQAIEESADASLFNIESFQVEGDHPVLVFRHKFDTEQFFDAGSIFISNNDGFTWQPIDNDLIIRSNYAGKLPFSLFALAGLRGWHGQSEGWETAMIDLSDYLGDEIRVRFRFATNDDVESDGWIIDDIELLDARHYNSEACLTSAEQAIVCTSDIDGGTYVNYGIVSSNENVINVESAMRLYPNPASDKVILALEHDSNTELRINIIDANGRLIEQTSAGHSKGMLHELRVDGYAPGIYFIKVVADGQMYVSRFIVE